MENDVIFQPLWFRNLTVKNRLFRSNISGRFDNYDGSGTQARINWEEKFARGGVGAILSSFCPVHIRGRIVPNYAMIDDDDKIPFWRKVGEAVHRVVYLWAADKSYRLIHRRSPWPWCIRKPCPRIWTV
jgi:2,4-dienoyl-CoA reductase-like NADH-dependent reductase (Old Yellow Enzyme family)